jgi:shikimate dehydrogenase
MKKFGLIGYPLGHSFSPGFFKDKFAREGIEWATYQAYPLTRIEEIETLFDQGIRGLNVTIPYKESVLSHLTSLDPISREIGAVNTILISEGEKIGYNTDVYGFEMSLRGVLKGRIPNGALILGSGGASKAVIYVLDSMGVEWKIVSRSRGDLSYDQIDTKVIEDHMLIINTTPLGMAPKTDEYPRLPYDELTTNHILFDLIYNPEKTIFLERGESRGCTIKNGLEMLELQAEKSWEIWNN